MAQAVTAVTQAVAAAGGRGVGLPPRLQSGPRRELRRRRRAERLRAWRRRHRRHRALVEDLEGVAAVTAGGGAQAAKRLDGLAIRRDATAAAAAATAAAASNRLRAAVEQATRATKVGAAGRPTRRAVPAHELQPALGLDDALGAQEDLEPGPRQHKRVQQPVHVGRRLRAARRAERERGAQVLSVHAAPSAVEAQGAVGVQHRVAPPPGLEPTRALPQRAAVHVRGGGRVGLAGGAAEGHRRSGLDWVRHTFFS